MRLNVKAAKLMQVVLSHENHNMDIYISARACNFSGLPASVDEV